MGTDNGRRNGNAHVVTMSINHGSANELLGTDSGLKTEIGVDETVHARKENGKRSGESGLVHETTNSQWSKNAKGESLPKNPPGVSGLGIAHHPGARPGGMG